LDLSIAFWRGVFVREMPPSPRQKCAKSKKERL
jgi:hypothetical protein